MNKFLIIITACVLLNACKPGIPKNIIQPDEMEKVLYDIHLIDGYASGLNFPTPDSTKKMISPFYKGVFKKYRIDSALFNQSLNYYYKKPKLMKEMYDHITDKLSKAKDKAIKPVPVVAILPKPVDSSKKVNQLAKPKINQPVEVKPTVAMPTKLKKAN